MILIQFFIHNVYRNAVIPILYVGVMSHNILVHDIHMYPNYLGMKQENTMMSNTGTIKVLQWGLLMTGTKHSFFMWHY